MDLNKQWMAKGNIGCTFAALFAKNPLLVNWVTVVNPDSFYIPKYAAILSIQFPYKNKEQVLEWAHRNGFYDEVIKGQNKGLRYKIGSNVSWVQYFGPDSHVVTRQAPIPELMMCVRLPKMQYAKVGFKGILHLAHASVEHLKERVADKLWETSYKRTKAKLGHAPTISEAAKTTFIA